MQIRDVNPKSSSASDKHGRFLQFGSQGVVGHIGRKILIRIQPFYKYKEEIYQYVRQN